MTRTFTQLLAFALVAISSFTACTKTTPKTFTKDELIGNYTIISITGKTESTPEENIIDIYLDECQKDDLMILKSDLTLQMVDAGTTCVPSSNDDTGDWNVVGDTFYWNGEPYRVKSLTSTTLVIDQTNTDNNVTEVITITLTRR